MSQNNWITELPSSHKLWFDTDIGKKTSEVKDEGVMIYNDAGNDIDDVLALLCCLHMYGRERLLGVSTTFYRPDQKARIARTILDSYRFERIPVYAGIGIYDPETEGEAMINTIYKPWPLSRFGYPWSPDSISALEARAYRDNISKFDSIPVNKDAINALSNAIETERENLVILCLGFVTNIAAVWDKILQHKVNRIVMMGGWFEDEYGEVKRLGYNTAVDLVASRKLLQQKDVPILIVNSEFCKNFVINTAEYRALQKKGNAVGSRVIARAICQDMRVWMEGKNQEDAEEMIHIGDPLAAYLARHPEEIADATPVEIQINDYQEGVDMFDPRAKNYVSVKIVPESNIMVVRSVKNPEKMRSQIVDYVSKCFDWKKF